MVFGFKKNSSLSFKQNFTEIFPKPQKNPILYDVIGWIVAFLSTNWIIIPSTVFGTAIGLTGSAMVAIALFAVSLILSLSQDKPKVEASSLLGGGTLINTRSVRETLKVGYGTCRVGGNFVFFHTRGPENRRLSAVITYGHGPIEGIVTDSDGDKIWFDEKRVSYYDAFSGLDLVQRVLHYGTLKHADYATKIRIEASTGATTIEVDSTSRMFINEDIGIVLDNGAEHWTTISSITDADTVVIASGIPAGRHADVGARVYTVQVADPLITAEKSDWADAMRGIAYEWFLLIYNIDAFMQLPLITAELKLRRIKDTRIGEIAWSQNRALATYDFMTNSRYGRGIPESLIDQDSVNDAANWCDSNGYTFDGLVADDKSFSDNLLDIMGQRLRYIWSEGKYKFIILKEDPAVMTLKEDDIIDGTFQIHVPGIPETPTRIKAWFLDKKDNYTRKSFFVDQIDNTIYPISENDDRTPEIILNGTVDYQKAVVLAKYDLGRRRFNKSFSLMAKARAVALEAGDTIYATYSFPGWTNKKLRVIKADIPQGGQIPLLLQEEDPAIYDPSVDVAVYESYESTLPGGIYNPEEPQNLSATTGPDESTVNKYDAYIDFQWDYVGQGYSYVLNYRKSDVSVWNTKNIACPYGVVDIATKTGTGTLKLTSGGAFYGLSDTNYKIEIDGAGSPNTFKWSDDGGSTWDATAIPITAGWQNLNNGAKIKFSAITGGVIGDFWTFIAHTPNPVKTKITGFQCAKEIYWRVRSIDPDGNKSEFGTADAPITTWGPDPPANVVIDDLESIFDGPYPVLKWGAVVPQPEFYEIRTEDANWGGAIIYSPVIRVASGLLSLSIQGESTALSPTNYKIEIDGIGGTDTFKWSDDGGLTWDATGVGITADWQALNNSVQIKFDNTLGGVVGDYWTFSIYPNTKMIALLSGQETTFGWTEYIKYLNANFVIKAVSGTLKFSLQGDFTGASTLHYKIQIDAIGSPNTFKWSDDGGSTWDATGVAITAGWQTLNNGVQVKFSATTGGKIGDNWTFDVFPNTKVGLTRTITVYIKARNKIGVCSALADSIVLTNGAPSMSGYSPILTLVKPKVKVDWMDWVLTHKEDIESYEIYGSTLNPTPIEDQYKICTVGANTHYALVAIPPAVTFDIRMRPNDQFGKGVASN